MLLRRALFLLVLLLGCIIDGKDVFAGRDKSYTKTIETYEIPDVNLVNQDGVKIPLKKYFACDKPVFVDFIFTTCTTICPVLSANFSNFQKKIIGESGAVRLVSISIDPEFDTPKEMKIYLKRYQAKPGWDFLTGSRADIDRVLAALNVYTLNKMNHQPIFLLKSPSKAQWVRLYGLIGTSELLAEYEGVRD